MAIMKKHMKPFNVTWKVGRLLDQGIFYKSIVDESGFWPKQKGKLIMQEMNQRSVDKRGIFKQGISFWPWRWRLEG